MTQAKLTARLPVRAMTGALVVTRHPDRFEGCGAVVVGTAEQAMALLARSRRFSVLFADVGQIGGVNGYRFVGALKAMAHAPVAYLMTDNITEHDRQYASRNGARKLIRRSLSEVMDAYRSGRRVPDAEDDDSEELDPSTQQLIQLRVRRLTRILLPFTGPVAQSLVSRTLDAQQARSTGDVSVDEMARSLSAYIEDPAKRARFLSQASAI